MSRPTNCARSVWVCCWLRSHWPLPLWLQEALRHIPAYILDTPIAGIRNNYWYDYRSDIEEAESELRKDLLRAKTRQDKREAWAEYNRELRDARSDYRKEMIEKGYILRRGVVTVEG